MIESEALKWNSSKDEWEKDLRINYTYEGKTVTTNYYKWNAKKQAYVLVPEMTVTMDNTNMSEEKCSDKYIVMQGFNFELRQGERVFLHGKNGCGKSSFIKAILQHNSKPELLHKNSVMHEKWDADNCVGIGDFLY